MLREFPGVLREKAGSLLRNGQEVVDFTSWDLLGVNHQKSFRARVEKAVSKNGFSNASPRLLGGNLKCYDDCETVLSKAFGEGAGFLFSTKEELVFSLFLSLIKKGDLLLCSDETNAPVDEATRLCEAELRYFMAKAPYSIEPALHQAMEKKQRVFLLAESISPCSGSPTDLSYLARLSEKFNCELVLDLSFGFSPLPLNYSSIDRPSVSAIKILDLASFAGAFGAMLMGNPALVAYLVDRVSSVRRPIPISVPCCEAILASFEWKLASGKLAKRLFESLDFLKSKLSTEGFVISSTEAPFLSIECKTGRVARELAEGLLKRGFLVEKVSSKGGVHWLRVLVHADHSLEQCASFLNTFLDLYRRFAKDVPRGTS